MMRVLYLNPFSQEISGPDQSLRSLLKYLIPRGLEAHVVLPAEGPQIPRYRDLGAAVHVAPLAPLRRDLSISALAYPARLARAAMNVAAIARQVGAQLIHTNMEILLEGALAAGALQLPHVLHYRGNTLDSPKLVFDALTAAWTGGADLVYCISEATAGVFRRRNRGRNVEVLYNPVEVQSFREAAGAASMRAQLGATDGELLVGTVGRIHPRKNLETFIRAAAVVTRKLGDRVKFVIVGTAEADVELSYRAEIEELVRSLNLGATVRFAGALRDMPAVMGALDVFTLTSRHEGFGRVVAEAMAAGRPVVVSDEGALPELVGHGAYGRLASALVPADFADRILELLSDRDEARRLGALAAQSAARFDGPIIADRVWSRYRALIDQA